MQIKLFEVRDSATFIPVMAVRLRVSERFLVGRPPADASPYEAACYTTPATAKSFEQEDYLLRRAGFCHIPEVILCCLECGDTERIASYDPFACLCNNNPALYGAIMFYGAGMLPRLRLMPRDELQKLANAVNTFNQEEPLHLAEVAKAKRFDVPLWSSGKLSGAQVLALMVFSLWVLCGEQEEMCSSLCETWPIKEAVFLSREQKT